MQSEYRGQRMILVLCWMEQQDSTKFYHTAENGTEFKTCELLISIIFHLIFSDCNWSWITETGENYREVKTTAKMYNV